MPINDVLVSESNRLFRRFMGCMAPTTGRGRVDSRDGVFLAWGNVPLPFLNSAALETPVVDKEDLRRRIAAAAGYGAERGLPWLFVISHDWLPPAVEAELDEAMEVHGLVPALPLTGMATDVLEAPTRTPDGLTIREVTGEEAASILSELNCAAYGIEPSIGAESFTKMMFDDVVASVGYAGSTPVACSGTIVVDDVLYVAFVATDPAHQRRGYAEAVMRHSLEIAGQRSGLTRTSLHATEAGKPVYERMGYRVTGRFTAYSLPH